MKKDTKSNLKHRYSKKQFLIACVLLIFIIVIIQTLGRYIIDRVKNTYSESIEFYFYSDKLREDNPIYQFENWNGVDNYPIAIGMNSMKNDLLSTSYDISYNISYTCSSNIICQPSKTNSIIYSSNNIDSFNVLITPNGMLNTGDKATIEITATTSAPYAKTLQATFVLVVVSEEFSYEIIDSPSNPYLVLNVRNATPSPVTIDLSFDPDDILLDMTGNDYSMFSGVTYATKGSFSYINGVTFTLPALSSDTIRFYKVNKLLDYTYPGVAPTPIITVTEVI